VSRGPDRPYGPPASGDYTTIRVGATCWSVRADDATALARSAAPRLLEGRGTRAVEKGHGRGAMALLAIGGRTAIGKRALHGGFCGRALAGLYLGHGRIEAAAEAALRLRSAGVPTPEVIAAGWRSVAGPFCALALLTEAIPGESLHARFSASADPPRERRALLRAAGEAVRKMHDAGFVHADLNLGNLVVGAGGGEPIVHIIDLDGGRFTTPPLDRAALGNLRRLLRSWEKFIAPEVPADARDLVAFLRGYTRDTGRRRRLAAALMRYRSRLGLRRIVWRWTA
jgi:3-deoxy-D-manno-octulosonic acid kinase